MEKDLLDKVGHVTVDFTYMGFSVTPKIPLASAGGCQSCSVGGGCSS